MATHHKSDLPALLRRRSRILRELDVAAPALAAELRAVDVAIEQISEGRDKRFLGIRSTKEAILACLGERNSWMKKREIANTLLEGGFAMDPEQGPRLVVDNINHQLQRKALVYRPGDAEGKDGLVGLPEWLKRKTPPSRTS